MDKAAREKALEQFSDYTLCNGDMGLMASCLLKALDALDAADSDNARLRARVGELEAAQEWRPISEAQIKHMVDRFLQWQLPKDFNPDAGISYTRPNYAPEVDATPSGTNLFDGAQAEEMVRFMIDGLPAPPVGDR